MHRFKSGLLLLMGVLSIGISSLASGAASGEPAERDRWIPSAAFFSMGNPERREGQTASDALPPAKGKSTGFAWSVGGSAEIATPVFFDLAGEPRFYAHADVGWATEGEDLVVSQGDPGPPSVFGTVPVVQSIQGVGQELRSQIKPLLLTGGIGTIWRFEAFDRTFRIRPSLEWMYQRQTLKAVLGAGENEGTDPFLCQPCRLLFIDSQTEKGFHSLGPGLEVEVEAAQAGDVLVTFFAAGRAYRILGDRRAVVGGMGAWERTDGAPTTRPDTNFVATYERKPWHYRFGFGFRLSWLPR